MSKTIRMEPSAAGPSAEARARADALVGRIVSERYRLEAVLACSERGAVYRGEHVAMRLRVVVKILHADAASDDVARFEREAIAGAHVRHPNVAAVTDSGGFEGGARYLVLEHVAGATLREALGRGRLDIGRAVHVARQIAAGLAAAHDQGIVHRDIEPQNVMLTGAAGDEVKIVDFGLAAVDLVRLGGPGGPPARALTAFGATTGLGPYAPPEAALGLNGLDARADLYALGVVLYEMLAGRRPFAADDPAELFGQQRRADPPPLPAELGVPPALEAALMRLLRRDRAERYGSAQEAAEALAAAVATPSMRPSSRRSGSGPGTPGFVPRVGAAQARGGGGVDAAIDAARDLARRAGRAIGDACDRALRRIGAASGKPLRLPTWALAAVASLVPLAFTVAWLVFRTKPATDGAAAASATASASSSAPVVAASPSVEAGGAAPPAAAQVEPGAPAPPTAAPARSSAVDRREAAAQRDRLRDMVKSKDWPRAGQAVLALAAADPDALREGAVISWVLDTAVALDTKGGEDDDKLFDLLTEGSGTDGLEILFEIVRSRGGTRASRRAADALRKPAVAARMARPLRVAFELRDASCEKKPELYARVVEEGDRRALTELRVMRESECDRRRRGVDPCCFDRGPLDRAIQELRDRIKAK